MIAAPLRERIGAKLGARIRELRGVSGGDINDAWRVALDDGRTVFVKTNAEADPDMFPAEARGLAWLREADALTVPEVIAVDAEYLVLEYLEPGRPPGDFDERLGRGLAALHRAGPGTFGLDHDNFIGRLPQHNTPRDDWPTFYRECRLEPQLRMAADRGRGDARLRRDFERLFARLRELLGPPEPPARLHGDLWGGNLHRDAGGRPVLVDPAVYGGHREVDLAMMQLFGGFSPRCVAAYAQAWPLAPGHEERVPLYQLYPLLVHVNLFGGGYLASVERILRRHV